MLTVEAVRVGTYALLPDANLTPRSLLPMDEVLVSISQNAFKKLATGRKIGLLCTLREQFRTMTVAWL